MRFASLTTSYGAAVAGKIDVRGWCADSGDAEAELPRVAEPGGDYLA